MTRKSVSILLSLLLILAAMPVPALGTTIGADVTQNLPIESRMETIADAQYINTQLTAQNGSAALVQDKAKGKYAVKTTVGDVYGAYDVQYVLASSGLFNVAEYSQVNIWVKPAAGAKWIELRTNGAMILGDANNDGRYQVGKDLISGKWNQVKLDLTNTTPKITQGFGLSVKTNDISSWYFDEITSNTTTTFAVNLARLKNTRTQITANGSLQFNPKTNGAYDTTPTILMSETKPSFNKTETTQTDFQLVGGTPSSQVTATSTGELELAPESTVALDVYTKLLMHMDGPEKGTVFADETGKAVLRTGNVWTKAAYNHLGSASAQFTGGGSSLTIPSSPDWQFGTHDFTIESFVYFDTVPTGYSNPIVTCGSYSSGTPQVNGWYFGVNAYNATKYLVFGQNPVASTNAVNNGYRCDFALVAGRWYHVAVVKNSGIVSLCIDGQSMPITMFGTAPTMAQTTSLKIGAFEQNGANVDGFNGYIDELRISKEMARWTPGPDAYTVPYVVDGSTHLLAHMDGANLGTVFTESVSGTEMTRNGGVFTKTDTKIAGTASGYFSGGSGTYLTAASRSLNQNGNYTIEAWIKPGGTLNGTLLAQFSNPYNAIYLGVSPNYYYFYATTTEIIPAYGCYNQVSISGGSPSIDKFTHVAAVHSGSSFMLFINGKLVSSASTTASMLTSGGPFNIGASVGQDGAVGSCFTGNMDELRISNSARYSSDFVPYLNWSFPVPTAPYNTVKYYGSGYRITPPMDISAVGTAQSSKISWTAKTDEMTSVTIEAALSTDGGATYGPWQPCKNGDPIPGINAGTNLANTRLQIKQSLTAGNLFYTPQIKDMTVYVAPEEYADSPALPNGKITRIVIDSNYAQAATGDTLTVLPSSRRYLEAEKPTKFSLSGDASRMAYLFNGQLCLFDLNSGAKPVISGNISPVDFKLNNDGSKVVFRDSGNSLYLYSSTTGNAVLIATGVSKYYMNNDGRLCYHKTADNTVNFYDSTVSQVVYAGSPAAMDLARNTDQIYFSNGTYLSKVTKTPAGWRNSIVTSVYSAIDGLWTNNDGSLVFLHQADNNYYVYEAYSKGLRRLNMTAAAIVRITEDNWIVAQDANLGFFTYDPETDQTIDIRPSDAKNPGSASELYFDTDRFGRQIAYVMANTLGTIEGIGISQIGEPVANYSGGVQTTAPAAVQRPERYLFSFDGKNSWLSYKDGDWTEVTSDSAPVKADFDKYGMTIDQVNKLTERDFASLYEDGRQVYTFDVAVWFASVNPYITPSLNGITVTLSRSNNGFGNELTEKALFAAKQQTFDGANWRKVRKVYPVELSPKDAEMYYFIKLGEDCLTYKDNVWQTVYGGVYDNATGITTVSGTPLLDDVEANWINITFKGMSAAELRAIPEAALTEKLANKSFAVVYCMKVLDETTKAYKSQLHVDYVEALFSKPNLSLSVKYNDGSSDLYTGLTKEQVEDFMQWVNERQFNRGPVYYRLTIGDQDEFINYYMILKVKVVGQS